MCGVIVRCGRCARPVSLSVSHSYHLSGGARRRTPFVAPFGGCSQEWCHLCLWGAPCLWGELLLLLQLELCPPRAPQMPAVSCPSNDLSSRPPSTTAVALHALSFRLKPALGAPPSLAGPTWLVLLASIPASDGFLLCGQQDVFEMP